MQQSTTKTTTAQAFEDIVIDLERRAAEYAKAHSNKLRRLTEAHRRERFIDWYDDYGEDEPLNQLLAAHYEMIGEREPDELSNEEYREIVGLHYDRFDDEERASVERDIRRLNSGFYFDDHYYSDEMIGARNQWNADIRELVSRARDRLYDQYTLELSILETEDELEQARKDRERAGVEIARIATQYQPVSFNCDACGADAHSHDETGALIAGVGVWALTDGSTGSYIVCEACKDKPDTQDKLAELFTGIEEAQREADRQLEEEFQKLVDAAGDNGPQPPLRKLTEDELELLKRELDATDPAIYVPIEEEFQKLVDAAGDNGPQQAATGTSGTSGGVGQNSGSQAHSGAQGGPQPRPSGAAAPQPGVFEFLSFDQVLSLQPKQWIVDQIIGPGDLATLFGEPGSGKTFVALDLAFAACLGRKWAGHFDIPKPLTVAYAAGEGAAGLRDRFDSAAQAWGVTGLQNLTLIPATPQLFATPQSRKDTIETFVTEWQASRPGQQLDLLIIDTWHTATVGAEENSARDTGIIIDRLRKTIRDLGCAILILHHTDKNGENYRGSSSLHGAMDCMIKAKSGAMDHTLSCTKLKDGSRWTPRNFSLIAKGASAVVVWGGAASGPTGAGSTLRDEILELFRDNPQAIYDVSLVLASLTDPNANRSTVQSMLAALAKEKHLDAWREDPTATRGPKSKWLYRLSALDATLSMLNP